MIATYSNIESAFETTNWKAAHASVTGSKHFKNGATCQDASMVKTNPRTNALAACACDGAGSARLSDLGAQAVANAVTNLLCENAEKFLNQSLREAEILNTALTAINELVTTNGGEAKDYACTIVALLVTNEKALTVHLGDGVIAMVEDGSGKVLSSPDNGEFANETFFVTSPRALDKIRVNIVPISENIKSFALMTDGASASLYDKRKNIVSSVVEQMASWLDDAPAEEVNLGMHSAIQDALIPKTDDDCTVAVVRRGNFLEPFSCPQCKAIDSLRGSGTKSKFKIHCELCNYSKVIKSQKPQSYPDYAREWVKFLTETKFRNPKQIYQITSISIDTIRRWSRCFSS